MIFATGKHPLPTKQAIIQHIKAIYTGMISQQQDKQKARPEYDKYRRIIDIPSSQVDKDLTDVLKLLNDKQNKK
ncbi:hypothetical protein XNC1_3929 [Xenorhabdus nematophila ATCC 19061]|uniref:Uncharacterized protein n=1 Tax=Xenorhabdus nematophila (strain ATCC 19061 / DSM 3370 / CCUG 14189 / LMG 1036 / NCIMB 9965 / AN6) TaxID=406817 RepID=D3VBW8_XENNA|nr:hypothetical protein XNC1_3929 [Xenorhabdus nematophila ATCC 19061]